MWIKTAVTFLFFAALTVPAGAYGPAVADGGLPGEFLSYFSVSPRSQAMGGTSAAASEGVYGSFHNPSLMAGVGKHRLGAMFTPLLGGGTCGILSYSYPFSLSHAAGLGLASYNSAYAVKRNAWGGYEGEFNERKTVLVMSASHRAGEKTRIGESVKVVIQEMDGYSDTAVGLDAGADFSPSEKVRLALFVQNIIPPALRLKNRTDTFPLNISIGGRVLPYGERLVLASDFGLWDPAGQSTFRWALGGEFKVTGGLYARAGLNYKNLSCGLGIETDIFGFSYALRYSDAGLMHSVGTTYMFSMLPSAREIEIARRERLLKEKEKAFEEWKKERRKLFTRGLQERYSQLEEEIKQARLKSDRLESLIEAARMINRGDYEAAEKALGRILQASPDDKDASVMLGIVEDELRRDFSFGRMTRFYNDGQYREAAHEATKAPSSHPQYLQARILLQLSLARIDILEENFESAVRHLEEILEAEPDNSAALSLLRRALRLMEITR